MKKFLLIAFITLLQSTLITTFVHAQATTESGVKILGEVTMPLTIKTGELDQFKREIIVRKDRDGKDHNFSGVPLQVLLAKAGVTLGKDLRGENLTKLALIEASDGYQVVFALADLDNSFTDRGIILADHMDDKPLPLADGPFRIIVQDEKVPARCIKQVTSIKIVFAK